MGRWGLVGRGLELSIYLLDDFNNRNKVLTAKLLRQGVDIIKFVRRFQNFIGGILT